MKTQSKLLIGALPVIMAGTFGVTACNDSTAPSPVTVNVTEREFNIALDRASAPRGTVIFHVTNVGADTHEFLVIRTDRAPNALPTEANGSYQENGAGTSLLDEIDEVDPGQSKDLTISLDNAKYVLICNMVHVAADGSQDAHYARGMRTAFRVD